MTDPAISFGQMADSYEAGRPGYPAAAVAWALTGARQAPFVVDAGAGTGKLTRGLVELGARVTAVDPDAAMLEVLRTKLPAVTALVGTGERLPLPDAVADVVVFGQAWHWVDPVAASQEVARVLRPAGTLGLIWNIRDETVPWIRELTGIMHGSAAEELLAGDGPVVASPFGPAEHRTWEWTRSMTVAELHDMVRSRSYVITAPEPEQRRIDSGVANLMAEVADADGNVEVPYLTHVYRYRRP